MRNKDDSHLKIPMVNHAHEQVGEPTMPMPKKPYRPGHPSMHEFFLDLAREYHEGIGTFCFQLLYDYYLMSTGQPNKGLWQELIDRTIDKTLEQREQKSTLYPLPKKKERNEQSSSLQQNKNPQEKEEKQ